MLEHLKSLGMNAAWAALVEQRIEECNASRGTKVTEKLTLDCVINCGFIWRETPEGSDYWIAVDSGIADLDDEFFEIHPDPAKFNL